MQTPKALILAGCATALLVTGCANPAPRDTRTRVVNTTAPNIITTPTQVGVVRTVNTVSGGTTFAPLGAVPVAQAASIPSGAVGAIPVATPGDDVAPQVVAEPAKEVVAEKAVEVVDATSYPLTNLTSMYANSGNPSGNAAAYNPYGAYGYNAYNTAYYGMPGYGYPQNLAGSNFGQGAQPSSDQMDQNMVPGQMNPNFAPYGQAGYGQSPQMGMNQVGYGQQGYSQAGYGMGYAAQGNTNAVAPNVPGLNQTTATSSNISPHVHRFPLPETHEHDGVPEHDHDIPAHTHDHSEITGASVKAEPQPASNDQRYFGGYQIVGQSNTTTTISSPGLGRDVAIKDISTDPNIPGSNTTLVIGGTSPAMSGGSMTAMTAEQEALELIRKGRDRMSTKSRPVGTDMIRANTDVYVRLQPSTTAKACKVLKTGQSAQVHYCDNGWCKVTRGDVTGYSYAKYLDF